MDIKLAYKSFVEKSIILIQKNRKYIPFASLLIWYLKIPFLLKIFIAAFAGYIVDKVTYTIGFITLQSKAKNEALSFITAFQNPIDFPDDLVYKYSLMFFSVFITALLPFVVVFVLHFLLANNINETETIMRRRTRKILFYIFLILAFFGTFIIALHSVSFIAYIMLYSSKEISILESLLRYINGKGSPIFESTILSYDSLNEQIKYSFVFEIIGLIFLFVLWYITKLVNKKKKNFVTDFLSTSALSLGLLLGLLIIISHTLYGAGYFGKSLANYDLDFVEIEYKAGGFKTIQGLRIYEDENTVILRDSCDVTHSITSEEFHIISISKVDDVNDCGKKE